MSWITGCIIEVTKLLPICVGTLILLALLTMIGFAFTGGNSHKATGIDLIFAVTSLWLATVGVLNVVIGLVLSRLSVFGDTGRKMALRFKVAASPESSSAIFHESLLKS